MSNQEIKDYAKAFGIALWITFVIFLVISLYFPDSPNSAVNWGKEQPTEEIAEKEN